MNKLVHISVLLALAIASPSTIRAQKADVDLATEEGARRQAWKIELDRKLADAQAAERKGAFFEAAQLYTDGVDLIKRIGPGGVPESQQKQVLEGFTAMRLQLADQAQH